MRIDPTSMGPQGALHNWAISADQSLTIMASERRFSMGT
jgi:hypothetical protein